jgi:hypothetical protein
MMRLLSVVSAVIVILGSQAIGAEKHSRDELAQICAPFHLDTQASVPLSPVTAKTCTVRMSHGFPIPDPACTPGAINPSVTETVLKDKTFLTGCLRNNATSEGQKETTYAAYGITKPAQNGGPNMVCELDHLISIELGGADTLDNIWPQCGPADVPVGQRFFKQKDAVEDYLAKMVRQGKISLTDAQHGIATDWTQYLEAAQASKKK